MSDYIIHIDSNASGGGDGSISLPFNVFSQINWTTAASAISSGGLVNINLKRTSHWRDLLSTGASGVTGRPIVVQAYGTGAKPIINGASLVTGWTPSGAGLGSTWQATCGAAAANLCMINSIYRFAGASATALNNGEWFKSGTTLYFRWDAGNPDTLGVVVELGQRSSIINNARSYMSFVDLWLKNGNIAGLECQNTTTNITYTRLVVEEGY